MGKMHFGSQGTVFCCGPPVVYWDKEATRLTSHAIFSPLKTSLQFRVKLPDSTFITLAVVVREGLLPTFWGRSLNFTSK